MNTNKTINDNIQPSAASLQPPKRSKRLVSYKEFINGKTFRPEFLAGFRMYLSMKGISYLSTEQWNDILEEYKNR
jgi:hypothetical protein